MRRPTKILSKSQTFHGPAREIEFDANLTLKPEDRELAKRILDGLKDEQTRLDELHPGQGAGVGLAANQIIGEQQPPNMYVVHIRPERAAREKCAATLPSLFINTKFQALRETIELKPEGCLSLQGLQQLTVPRYTRIRITGFRLCNTETWQAEACEIVVDGFLARVHQHEQGHCCGEEYLHCLHYDAKELSVIQDWLEKNRGTKPEAGTQILPSLICTGDDFDYDGLATWLRLYQQGLTLEASSSKAVAPNAR